jgi:transposase
MATVGIGPISPERRRQLVAAYGRNGGNVAAAARETGVTIRTAHRWIGRFLRDGECGLRPRSHARKTGRANGPTDRAAIARVRYLHRRFPALTLRSLAAKVSAEGTAISKSSVHRALCGADGAAQPDVSPVIVPFSPLAESMERQLHEVAFLIEHARRREADALVIAASRRERAGGERWARLLLTYCPLLRQQAGDADGAEEIIARVERACREAEDHPPSLSPPIQALIENRRGWIHDGLRGDFDRAAGEFAAGKRLAQQAGDARLVRECGHFRMRVLVELAMTLSDSWLTARPMRALPAGLVRTLDGALTSPEWRAVMRDGDPHHYRFLFNMLAMIRPERAAELLADRGNPLATAPVLHMLSSARWHASDRAWDRAIAAARDASAEYCALRHPLGMAHAAAIAAHAYRRRGLRTREEMAACLDAWICALRLHPFATHPLGKIARRGLADTLHDMKQTHADWVAQYENDLTERVREREGAYRALDCTEVALGPVPSLTGRKSSG